MFLHNLRLIVTSLAKVWCQSNCHYNEFCRCIECRYKDYCLYFSCSSLLATEKSPVDPNSSEHIIAINRLQDQLEAMKKQLQSKDQQLMEKEKKVKKKVIQKTQGKKKVIQKIQNFLSNNYRLLYST